MQTFIDAAEFCDCVMAEANAQGWELDLKALDVRMRYQWQWTWKGAHSLPQRESMFPDRFEAKFCACLELVRQANWAMQVGREPMELERPPVGMAAALGRAVA